MTQPEALSILIQGVQIAQKRGTYNLQEAKTIAEAVSVFLSIAPNTENNVPETNVAENNS